jgi:hypothetical protein
MLNLKDLEEISYDFIEILSRKFVWKPRKTIKFACALAKVLIL